MTPEEKRAQLVQLKKESVIELLDTAVAVHGLSTEDYLSLKQDLLSRIERDTGHQTGLFQWLEQANMMAAQCLGDPSIQIAVGAEIREEILEEKPEKPRKTKVDAKAAPVDYKAALLRQIELLPPWLNEKEVKHYQELVRRLPRGKPSEGLAMNTVGDAEYELLEKVRERFSKKMDQLVAKAPELFRDKLEQPDGSVRWVNVEKNLRLQLKRVSSVRQFLAFKDLVARFVRDYKLRKQQAQKKGGLMSKLKFW